MEEKILNDATIIFLVRGSKVVLAVKADKIGKGCRNGYGGGIESWQTPEQNAVDEIWDESTTIVLEEDLEKVAIVRFSNITKEGIKFVCKCHVYLVRKWQGTPEETEEMLDPQWYDINDLPVDEMMLADPFWIPVVLSGKKIIAEATYGPEQKTLLEKPRYIETLYLPED